MDLEVWDTTRAQQLLWQAGLWPWLRGHQAATAHFCIWHLIRGHPAALSPLPLVSPFLSNCGCTRSLLSLRGICCFVIRKMWGTFLALRQDSSLLEKILQGPCNYRQFQSPDKRLLIAQLVSRWVTSPSACLFSPSRLFSGDLEYQRENNNSFRGRPKLVFLSWPVKCPS